MAWDPLQGRWIALLVPPLLLCFAVYLGWTRTAETASPLHQVAAQRRLQYVSSEQHESLRDEQAAVLRQTHMGEILFSMTGSLLEHEDKLYRIRSSQEGSGQVNVSAEVVGVLHGNCSSLLLGELELVQAPLLRYDSLGPAAVSQQFSVLPGLGRADPASGAGKDKGKQLLVVLTTCNQLAMTVRALQAMRLPELADLVIVDDHSMDGTAAFLRRKGYAVVAKAAAAGLTDSWNIGYRLASRAGYSHLLLMNNDVLLTAGSVQLLHLALQGNALVAPLTSVPSLVPSVCICC